MMRGIVLGLQAAADHQTVGVVDVNESRVEQLVKVRPKSQAILDMIALTVHVWLYVGRV
jgi:hypothetical protein